MAALLDVYIKEDVLEVLLKTLKAKKEKGIALTVSINDETNDYGQNVSSYVSQSKEDRDAKKQKYYVGNGKVFWSDGKITVAERKNTPTQQAPQVVDNNPDNLPF